MGSLPQQLKQSVLSYKTFLNKNKNKTKILINNELVITIENVDLLELFGEGNHKLNMLIAAFPNIKVTQRGSMIWLAGEKADLQRCREKLELMVGAVRTHGKLAQNAVEDLLLNGGNPFENQLSEAANSGNSVIVYGTGGRAIRAKTKNQRLLVEMIEANDLVFAIGPAGTGKTYTAVAMAVRALKNRLVKKIILARPAIEAGENLGFLPGDLKEKIDPYLQPLYDALEDMIPSEKLKNFMENRIIEVAPLAFMRGRTLDNAFIILDEAQNATSTQLKMFLTRMGPSAKAVVTGDLTQIDLPKNQKSGLYHALGRL